MQTLNHPWNAFEREPKGDADTTTIYTAVGRALSNWEWLESTLAETFKLLCHAEFDGAVRAYGSVAAFTGRRAMLDAAFDVFPFRRKDDVKGFPKYVEKVKNFSARRNEIAHGMVIGIGIQGESLGSYLCPASYNSNKQYTRWDIMDEQDVFKSMAMNTGKYAYTSEQVLYYGEQFLVLREEAIPWMRAIRHWAYNGV